jgi:hypothetical protein
MDVAGLIVFSVTKIATGSFKRLNLLVALVGYINGWERKVASGLTNVIK